MKITKKAVPRHNNINMDQKEKALEVCRVSSKEQEETGYSLEAQEKLLTDYAADKGYEVAKVYKITESATGKQVRKLFYEMLQYATKHNIRIILCEKIDRLTRNPRDAVLVDDWVLEEAGREVHFFKENFVLNANTKAHENLVWDMKVAIARFYSNNLSEEVRKGQKEKLSQGWLPTKPPLGYKTVGDAGHKIHVIDDDVAPLVRQMFEYYATGNYSITVLVEAMYKKGLRNRAGKKVGKSRMYDMLRDPFYYGAMQWNGEVMPAKHDALITRQTFDRVQILLTRTLNHPQFNKHVAVFKAKLVCGRCGGSVTWEKQKGHWYGHCNGYKRAGMTEKCSERSLFIRQEKLEELLLPYFVKVAPKNQRVLDVINEALKESHAEEVARVNSQRVALNATVERNQKRIEQIYEDKLDGKVDPASAQRLSAQYTLARDEATEALKRLNSGNKQYYEAGYAIHMLAARAKEIYHGKKTTDEDRRLLLSYGFQNIVLEGREIKPEYTLAFDFLANWVPKLNKISEPGKTVENLGRKVDSVLSHPVWLRG